MISKISIVAAAFMIMETQQQQTAAGGLPTIPSEIGYFDTAGYQAKTWSQKLNELWQQALAENTSAPSLENWNLDGLFKEDIKITFNRSSDEMPEGRLKFNHSQGVLAKIQWVDIGGHDYTGLYQGNSEGIIRMSEGNFNVPEMPGLTPTFALKFPRTKIRSVNWTAGGFEPNDATKTPAGTSPFDFFAKNFCTSCSFFSDPRNQQTIQKKFAEFSTMIGATGKAEFSRFDKDGNSIKDFKFPFGISFRPPTAIKGLVIQTPDTPWYTAMKAQNFPIGTVLLDVFARTEPQVTDIPNPFPNARQFKIGEIRLNSEIITSSFGDKRLFFQHESMVLDQVSEPAWKDYTERLDTGEKWNGQLIPDFFPGDTVSQKAAVRGQIHDYGCPFAWLLGEAVNPIF